MGYDAQQLWLLYGTYADRMTRDGKMPLCFDDWLTEQRRLAGEQDELF